MPADKVEQATELAKEATRRTHEAVADAKAVRIELRSEIDEAKTLMSRLEHLRDALSAVLEGTDA